MEYYYNQGSGDSIPSWTNEQRGYGFQNYMYPGDDTSRFDYSGPFGSLQLPGPGVLDPSGHYARDYEVPWRMNDDTGVEGPPREYSDLFGSSSQAWGPLSGQPEFGVINFGQGPSSSGYGQYPSGGRSQQPGFGMMHSGMGGYGNSDYGMGGYGMSGYGVDTADYGIGDYGLGASWPQSGYGSFPQNAYDNDMYGMYNW